MISHIGIGVSNLEKSKAFYTAALKPLGYEIIKEFPEWNVFGMGVNGNPDFWVSQKENHAKIHIAFAAKSEEEMNAFYDAAIAAGGKDNGKPGPRPDYSPTYYGAFVLDPDGNNIEAVYFKS